MGIKIVTTGSQHVIYAEKIAAMIVESAKQRGTGIASRTPEYLAEKIIAGKAVIALDGNEPIGFSYIETWGHGRFVANSGLIVNPEYRNQGLAKKIKNAIFELSRKKYPKSKIFGITTGLAVMKINSALGYVPVTFSELTSDPEFWKGCESCKNYDILSRNNHRMCLCTGMLYDPAKHSSFVQKTIHFLMQFKRAQKLRFKWWLNRRRLKRKEQRKNKNKV